MTARPINWTQYLEIGLGQLRLSPDAFWNMSMGEFFAAVRGYTREQDAAFLRAGTIAAQILNVHRDPKKHGKPLTAGDIFPHLKAHGTDA